MSILQRYVLREILGPLGMGLTVFTFVILIGQVFQLTEVLFNSTVPGRLAGELILLLLPGILSITIPMAVLVAVLLGIGRLAADREILAIRTTGINLWHICVPILMLAATLSAAMAYTNQKLIPVFNQKSTDVQMQLMFYALSALPAGVPNELPSEGKGGDTNFFYDRKGTDGVMHGFLMQTQLLQAPGDDAKSSTATKTAMRAAVAQKAAKNTSASLVSGGKLKQGKLSDKEFAKLKAEMKREEERLKLKTAEDRKLNEALVVANHAEIIPDIANRVLNFELTSGSIHFGNPDNPTAYDIVRFDKMVKGYVPSFNRTEGGSYLKGMREMSSAELLEARKTGGKRSGAQYTVEYFQRFSVPLACIAFAFIAIPLAVYVRPTGKALAFAISFLLILLYYGLLQYGVALGKTGSAVGVFAIFMPNILLVSVGSILLYRMVMK